MVRRAEKRKLISRFQKILVTLEKQAPIRTFGVGGRPLLIGRGGVCRLRSLRLGGTGGVLALASDSVSSSEKSQHKMVSIIYWAPRKFNYFRFSVPLDIIKNVIIFFFII